MPIDKEQYPDADVVIAQASGRWDIVISALCPALSTLVSNFHKNPTMPCPSGTHNKNGDGFRLWKKKFIETGASVCNTCGIKADGVATIMFVNGWSYPDTLKAIYDELCGRAMSPSLRRRELHIPPPQPVNTERSDTFAVKLINETWLGSVGLGHESAEPARLYLKRRGLVPCRGPLNDLRFHPALEYFEKQRRHDGSMKSVLVGRFPAIVAAIRQPDGLPAALHRIYLTADGRKAPVSEVKKMTPFPSQRSTHGAAVRLDEPGPVLHTTEGIETGLAVRIITEQPVWPAVNTTMLAQLELPDCVRLVFIWEDFDKGGAGAKAGIACQQHLQGRGVRAIRVTPEFAFVEGEKKVDWNDALNMYGRDALRQHEVCQSVEKFAREELRRTKATSKARAS